MKYLLSSFSSQRFKCKQGAGKLLEIATFCFMNIWFHNTTFSCINISSQTWYKAIFFSSQRLYLFCDENCKMHLPVLPSLDKRLPFYLYQIERRHFEQINASLLEKLRIRFLFQKTFFFCIIFTPGKTLFFCFCFIISLFSVLKPTVLQTTLTPIMKSFLSCCSF